MTLFEFTLLALSSLIVIIDPIAVIPTFLAMTPNDSPQQRIRMARIACLTAAGVLLLFSIGGKLLFDLLGIGLPAFQLAGSIVLLKVALDMLQAQRSNVRETEQEKHAAVAKDDIAITPLAVPMLAGPGAISTGILLHSRAETFAQEISLVVCIVVVCAITYFALALSTRGAKWLSPIAMMLIERLMGLLLAAIAMQFVVNALKDLKVIPA